MEALVNNIIKATGWSIFHSLWQGAFLYGILVLIFLMIPNLSARVKHHMAYGTLTLIFIGFCGTFFSLFTWPPLSTVTNTLSLSKVMPLKMGYQAELYFPFIVGLYVTGLFMQVAILSTGYYKVLQLKQSLKIAVPNEWQILFKNAMSNMSISKKVGFYLSDQVSVPLVIGCLKPIVLFPVAFATQLDLVHVEAILIHELAHIRRNDYMLNILKTVMETILFFNPFTWLCSNLIHREREHACDDCVVKHTKTPLTYAHALLQIELLKEKQTPAFSMAAGGDHQHLYQRIKRITDMKTTYNTTKQQLLAISITVVTLLSLAWINPLKSETKVKSKTTAARKSTINRTTQLTTTTIVAFNTEPQQDTLKKKKSPKITRAVPKLPKVPAPPEMKVPNAPIAPVAPPEPPTPPAAVADFTKYAQELQKHFNSPEWKQYEADLKKMKLDIRKEHESPEFKQHIEDLKNHKVVVLKHFSSPAWKQEQAQLKKMGTELRKQMNSIEFRKKITIKTEECTEALKEELKQNIEKEVQAAVEKTINEARLNN